MKKKIIIVFLIILLLVSLLLVILLVRRNKKLSDEDVPVDMYEAYKINRENEGKSAKDEIAHLEDNMNEYTTVKGIIDKFCQNVLYLNANAKDLDLIVTTENESKVLQEYKQTGLKYIQDVLAPNYKNTYSVDYNYIYNMLVKYAGKSYIITDMYVVNDSEYINTFFVYGYYGETEFNFVLVLDRYNNTYEMFLNNYLAMQGYSKNQIATMKTLNITSVEKNENNSFQYKNIGNEQLVNIYYKDYVNALKNNRKIAYSVLDSAYRQKRFDSFEKFDEYLNSKTNYGNLEISSYTQTTANGYTEYVCKDELGNNFIFKVTNAMKYTVLLDSYTAGVLAYSNEYEGASNARKVELSFNRFIESINNKDYEGAYSFLNSTYKQSQFPTVEDFKKYLTSTWFNINSFSYETIEVNSAGTYIVYGTINDYEAQGSYDAGFINKTFYIKLGSSYNNFEISFGK